MYTHTRATGNIKGYISFSKHNQAEDVAAPAAASALNRGSIALVLMLSRSWAAEEEHDEGGVVV